MKAPIETKVIAAAGGAGLGGAFGTFVLWLLGVLFWHASASADHATSAVAAVPEPVGGLIAFAIAGVGALVSGYLAPHTSRPDLHVASAAPEAPSAPVEPTAAPDILGKA